VSAGDEDSLMANIAHMQRALRQMIADIVASAGELGRLSGEVVAGAQAVADNSHQQSESATSMAASIEELTVSINHISDRAQDARSLSEQSGESSQQGSEVISRAVAEMRRINESVELAAGTINELVDKAQVISGIMQVIKDIADQTNLLALNAAIEAARAGELGRGFAVVADEVRKLAERTSQSTGEISGIVRSIQEDSKSAITSMQQVRGLADTSLQLSEQARDSIAEIRAGAKEVVQVVRDVSELLQQRA
ncbi:methyl-accepting chemotaxis protein, partial [Pseudomonas sp. MWU13-2860]